MPAPRPRRSTRAGRAASGLLLLFLCAGPAFAGASIAVATVGNPPDPSLSKVVGRAAAVQLQHDGISVPRVSDVSGASSTSQLKRFTRSSHGDFFLLLSYTQSNAQVRLGLTLRDARSWKIVGSDVRSVPFDLNLDSHVADTVARLLSQPGVESALASISAAPSSSGKTSSPSTSAGSPAEGGGHSTAPAKRAPGAPSGKSQRGGAVAGAEVPSGPGRVRFAAALRGAPLILVGNASNYFRYGGGVSLFAGVRVPFSAFALEGGALAGAGELFPAVGLSAGKAYTFWGGAEVGIGTPDRFPVRLGLRVASGAAVILAEPTGSPAEAKTDLFASGGVNATLDIVGALRLGIELNTLVVFETRYPIIAIAPSLVIGL